MDVVIILENPRYVVFSIVSSMFCLFIPALGISAIMGQMDTGNKSIHISHFKFCNAFLNPCFQNQI